MLLFLVELLEDADFVEEETGFVVAAAATVAVFLVVLLAGCVAVFVRLFLEGLPRLDRTATLLGDWFSFGGTRCTYRNKNVLI